MARVFIVGGATVDLFGIPFEPLLQRDSNPGHLQVSFGGVARNIAENLTRMQIPVSLITVIGNDVYGKELLAQCRSIGIDVDEVLVMNDQRTPTYLAILDHQNDMHIAISDMTILEHISISYLARVFAKVSKDDVLFIDTNFSSEIIQWMLCYAPCPVFVDPISSSKVEKLTGLFSRIHTFKPNLQEAEKISGIQVESNEDLVRLGRFFVDQGVKEVYISLGKDGCFGYSRDSAFLLHFEDVIVQNATGAGDALMAGLIHQYIHSSKQEDSIRFAMAVAALTVEHKLSVHPALSVDNVIEFLRTKKSRVTWL